MCFVVVCKNSNKLYYVYVSSSLKTDVNNGDIVSMSRHISLNLWLGVCRPIPNSLFDYDIGQVIYRRHSLNWHSSRLTIVEAWL